MNTTFFLPGMIGAIAPEIVRLYEVRRDPQMSFRPFYFVISLAYVLLGGYVAAIFPGLQGPFWAMCVGAGLVLVVNKMVVIGGKLVSVLEPGARKDAPAVAAGSAPPSGGFARRTEVQAKAEPGLLDYLAKL